MKESSIEILPPLPLMLQETANTLLQELETVKPENFNRIPFAGSWTAGQLAEHIRLSVAGIALLVKAHTGPTHRTPDKHVQTLKDMFMNFNLKFNAAPNITPAEQQYDKNKSLNNLKAVFDGFIDIAETTDLTDSCLDADFPGIGYLTRMEWTYLTVYHTKRHVQQLKNVIGHLNN